MGWDIRFHEDFEPEFDELTQAVQDELLAQARLLERFGPTLKRPHADTMSGSRHANMKELRFKAEGGVWRVAFAFDTKRKAILLAAGDKSGGSEAKFYKALIKKADGRLDSHLKQLKEEERRKGKGK